MSRSPRNFDGRSAYAPSGNAAVAPASYSTARAADEAWAVETLTRDARLDPDEGEFGIDLDQDSEADQRRRPRRIAANIAKLPELLRKT